MCRKRGVQLWEDLRRPLKREVWDAAGLLKFSGKRLTHSTCHMPWKHRAGAVPQAGAVLFTFVSPEPSAHATF